MFWKTKVRAPDFSRVGICDFNNAEGNVLASKRRRAIIGRIQKYGDSCTPHDRVALLKKLGEAFNVDYTDIAESRKLSLINATELREMTQKGIDIQLHTHRHRFPRDHNFALREINENRAAIEPLLASPMRHFCYPSGHWTQAHWPLLRQAGIETATIGAAKTRFIYKNTPK